MLRTAQLNAGYVAVQLRKHMKKKIIEHIPLVFQSVHDYIWESDLSDTCIRDKHIYDNSWEGYRCQPKLLHV